MSEPRVASQNPALSYHLPPQSTQDRRVLGTPVSERVGYKRHPRKAQVIHCAAAAKRLGRKGFAVEISRRATRHEHVGKSRRTPTAGT